MKREREEEEEEGGGLGYYDERIRVRIRVRVRPAFRPAFLLPFGLSSWHPTPRGAWARGLLGIGGLAISRAIWKSLADTISQSHFFLRSHRRTTFSCARDLFGWRWDLGYASFVSVSVSVVSVVCTTTWSYGLLYRAFWGGLFIFIFIFTFTFATSDVVSVKIQRRAKHEVHISDIRAA